MLALWNVNSHFLRILAVFIFFEVAQESQSKDKPRQITIFTPMLSFFTAKTPDLCVSIKFTNFAAIMLFFTNFCFAAINVNTASNTEIADFMERESKRILQVPDTSTLTINFQTAKDKHSRVMPLFFLGEREVSIKADYVLASSGKEIIKGSLKADTAWCTGYCGVIECQNKPMPAQQRIETLKHLISEILMELSDKVNIIFAEKKVEEPQVSAVDSTTEKQDSIQEQK